jgi:CDP-paratose 2-epimerase
MRSWLPRSAAGREKVALVTGGAGFIGSNLAAALARRGSRVIIYDNMSRQGVERNLAWLKGEYGELVEVEVADVRDAARLRGAARRADEVFHFAAQVAVTTSLIDPRDDLSINVVGTVNLLEAVRDCARPPSLVFTSTNKVYGGLSDMRFDESATRYAPAGGGGEVDEQRPLDFHSPYGCSKGAADQYVLDYCRSFGVPTAVLRMSCIYGPRQCGTEDQGWVAHFLIQALQRRPVTIFGDGKQVRDVLYVDDLVEAMIAAQANMPAIRGRAFNMGGGQHNTVSLLELVELIEALEGRPLEVNFGPWRTGDQKFYVSDHRAFTNATGWQPRVGVGDGVKYLHRWLSCEMALPREGEQALSPRRRVRAGFATPRQTVGAE